MRTLIKIISYFSPITCILFFSISFQGEAKNLKTDDFYVFVTSDPQFPWACPVGYKVASGKKGPACDNEKRAMEDNIFQVAWIRQRIAKIGDPRRLGGLVINGDLTAFGHDHEFKAFMKIWSPFGKIMEFLPGLGNHDYENNVNDCHLNHCASRMTNFMATHHLMNRAKPYYKNYLFDFDYKETYKFPTKYFDMKGSLSYSWDIGDVHFVQLQNHPVYKNSWTSSNIIQTKKENHSIESSLEWLRQDLRRAAESKKKIIINMHSHQHAMNSRKFRKIIKNYNVSAIFAGHLHNHVGKVNFPSACADADLNVPCFLSGASVYRSVLVLRFQGGKKMTVEAFRGKQHPPKLDPPYRASTKIYNIVLKESRIPSPEEEKEEEEKKLPKECEPQVQIIHNNFREFNLAVNQKNLKKAKLLLKKVKFFVPSKKCEGIKPFQDLIVQNMERVISLEES